MRESVLLFVLLTLAVVGCGGTQPAPGAVATSSPAVADSARASVAASTPAPSVSAAPLTPARGSGDEASCTDELLPFTLFAGPARGRG